MKLIGRVALWLGVGLLVLIVGFNAWGAFTLGTITPNPDAKRYEHANSVVMVFGATGSVGDGLLKAAMEDDSVNKVYVVTRRTSPRIEAAVAQGKTKMIKLSDFTDYSSLENILADVNTVLWGLGTSSFNVDDTTYTWIHVDFPVAFVKAWLAARTETPMSFHYVTGMGTNAEGSEHWAREKGRAESEVAELAKGSGLRTFGYRSAFIRPTSEQANPLHYLLASLLAPGKLVISAKELGEAMLEISTRSDELANGTVIDNADSITYAEIYARIR